MTSVFEELLGRKPEAILFDLDGTLVDSVPDLTVAVDAVLKEEGFAPAGEAQVRQWVGNGALRLVRRALAHGQGCGEQQVDQQQLAKAHQRFLLHYDNINGNYSRLYSGVSPALQHWQQQNIAMAIVTNKPIQFVPHLLESLNIAEFFSVFFGGECVSAKKPDPDMLLAACEQLQVKPEHCVMIGDSRNDIEAARRAAMPVVAVSYGYNHGRPVADELPDRLISSLAELTV